MRRAPCNTLAAALAAALLPGCFVILDHELPEGGGAEFVALPSDFADFATWSSVVVGSTPAATPHDSSERKVFLNAPPDDDATAFPVGTVIVKTGSGGELTGEPGTELHAMVKRGAGFNRDGAVGWEWFELDEVDSDLVIVWRGANPPAGESYGCLPGQDCSEIAVSCNECHAGSIANDFVNSSALTLGSLDASLLGGAP